MGFGPSLDVARDYFTCHHETYFCDTTHPKSADAVRAFQFGVRCFDPCTDPIPVFSVSGLLERVHIIPQTDLGGNLQTEVPDGVAGVAPFGTMVGSPHWTLLEHRTGAA